MKNCRSIFVSKKKNTMYRVAKSALCVYALILLVFMSCQIYAFFFMPIEESIDLEEYFVDRILEIGLWSGYPQFAFGCLVYATVIAMLKYADNVELRKKSRKLFVIAVLINTAYLGFSEYLLPRVFARYIGFR